MLRVQGADIDPDSGIVLIDPRRGPCTVRIHRQPVARPDASDPRVGEPFSDCGVGAFDPVGP